MWNKQIQNMVLSAYFYGYLTTQVLGGYLSLKLGAKITLAGAIFIGSVFTLLIPLAAEISYIGLIACRFVIGVAHVKKKRFFFTPSLIKIFIFKNFF